MFILFNTETPIQNPHPGAHLHTYVQQGCTETASDGSVTSVGGQGMAVTAVKKVTVI